MLFVLWLNENLPPIVQNWPNLGSDATRNPLSSVVTFVSLGSFDGCVYWTGGRSSNGFVNGGYGVTICSDKLFFVE